MLIEQLLSFLLLIPVTLGRSQVELEMLQEEIFIDGAGCNCTEEINKTKQQVEKKIEDLENQNKNLQDQFNTLQLKMDRLQQRSDGHEVCFEDLGSDNCVGSKSRLIGIVEAIRVDGGWGLFSDWSQCSAPCGGGVQVRNRTCNNPAPENGGKPCTGNGEEQRRCNAQQCFDSCEKSLCSSEDGCPLAKNTLLTTLPQLNKEFLVSFEFRATEYMSGWQSVIHFTEGGNCCGVGQRVPGFWIGSFGQLTPSFAVDGDGNYHVTTKKQYSANEWHTVVFSQTLKNGKYMYRVVIDGEDVITRVENKQPKIFYNVKVYAADSYYNPLKGSIRNLAINGCGGNWKDKELILYDHNVGTGREKTIFGPTTWFGDFNFNDIVSNIHAVKGDWELYTQGGYSGDKMIVKEGQGAVTAWLNDQYASARPICQYQDDPSRAKIQIIDFEHAPFQGEKKEFSNEVKNLQDAGNWGDKVSIIRAIKGDWELYEHPNYEGRRKEVKEGQETNVENIYSSLRPICETYSPISVQDGCYEEDTDYHGNDLNLSTGTNKDRRNSASECQKLCAQTKRCKFFTWKQSSKECWSKTKGGPGNSRQEKGSVSGPRVCGGRGASDQGRFNFPSQRGSRGGDLFGRIG